MTDKHHEDAGETPEEVGGPAAGSEANASGPAPDETGDAADLTVDDILATDQTDAALVGDDAVDLPPEAAGYLADLKRITAEYANYRRRTEEQRVLDLERAKGDVATRLLPVLDDLDRAEAHGDLVEGSPFAVIAEKIRGIVKNLGVVAYGEAGEEFDPQDHEAIFQQPTPGATTTTIVEVVEVGYRIGDTELRPAKVVVAVPAE